MFPPYFSPAELTQVRSVFDDPGFIYELKHDGFRALAHIEGGACRLVSRRGNVYKSFAPLRNSLAALNCSAVLDGEIVVLDGEGRPCFYDLLRRRGEPVFYAFDCLSLDGRDLRARPLIDRKRILAKLVKGRPNVLYAQHFDGKEGAALFRLVCEQGSRRRGGQAEGRRLRGRLVQNTKPCLFTVRRPAGTVREKASAVRWCCWG